MKNIFTLIIMFFAFSVSVNAQTDKREMSPQAKAKSDLHDLSQAINTGSDDMNMAVYALFLKKHETLQGKEISADQKREFSNIIDLKLKATFSDEQITKLKSVPGLYDKLIN